MFLLGCYSFLSYRKLNRGTKVMTTFYFIMLLIKRDFLHYLFKTRTMSNKIFFLLVALFNPNKHNT